MLDSSPTDPAAADALLGAVDPVISQIFPKLPTSQSFSEEASEDEDYNPIFDKSLDAGLSPFALQQIEKVRNELAGRPNDGEIRDLDGPVDIRALQSSELSDGQLHAIDLIIQRLPDTQVAEAVGVTRRTIYNWRHWEVFDDALRERRQMIQNAALDQIRSLLPDAMDLLGKQLRQESDPLQAYRAASLLLHIAMKQSQTTTRR